MQHNITVKTIDKNPRLDKFLSESFIEYSRVTLQKLINSNQVTVNGSVNSNQKYKLSIGDIITINLSSAQEKNLQCTTVEANHKIKLDIVYEDEYLAIINKQPNLTIHPGAGNNHNTLANALVSHYGNNLAHATGIRAGIVHRLDKDTSGFLIIAKTDNAHFLLTEMMRKRTIKRNYIAIVHNKPKPSAGQITNFIGRSHSNRTKMAVVSTGGRKATTYYQTLVSMEGISAVECQLDTGRTHQIRVHMAYLRSPILKDSVYGGGFNLNMQGINGKLPVIYPNLQRQALHAYKLSFHHPFTREYLNLHCLPPTDMLDILYIMGGEIINYIQGITAA